MTGPPATDPRLLVPSGAIMDVLVAPGWSGTLRELAPQLRDQLMVTMRDRALIEARAKGIDVEAALRHPVPPAAQA